MPFPWELSELDVEAVKKIDEECSQFESQLQIDQVPRIESYLQSYDGLVRQALLHELLVLELLYLRRKGNDPNKSNYRQRFQHDQIIIEFAFTQLASEPGKCEIDQTHSLSLRVARPTDASHCNALADRSDAAMRYKNRIKHAHGGMGEVFVASDSLVGRRVALKRLRSGRHGSKDRFVAEAQITGQLEHPGIVPLYDMGTDSDGQPFYVMKFVEGCTLRQSIQEYHSCCDEAEKQILLIQLLHVFVNLCQTVAFAHSRGVIHRDLKPDNVMLGAFGESLVLDWGVAKVVGTNQDHCNEVSSKLSVSGAPTTVQDYSIVGSPPYISPEAASGKSEEVTEQSDVYLLGGVLYEMLTGVAPRKGTSAHEVLELARNEDPPPPHRIKRSVPHILDSICSKSMSRRREDRYHGAMDLANDVQRFLADEPVTACREPLSEHIRRWIKRRRKLLLQITYAAVAIVSLVFAWQQFHNATYLKQLEQARNELIQVRRLGDEVSFYAANSNAASESVPYYDIERANEVADQAFTMVRRWGRRMENLPIEIEQPRLRDELFDLILWIVQSNSSNFSTMPTDRRKWIRDALDWAVEINPTSSSLSRLKKEWESVDRKSQVFETDQDPNAIPDRPMDHFLRGERLRQKAFEHSSIVRLEKNIDGIATQIEMALKEYNQAIALDSSHYWSHYQRGRCWLSLGKYLESIEAFGTCIALRDEVPWAYTSRGLAYALQNDFVNAMRDLDHAVAIAPGHPVALLNRGVVYRLMGNEHYDNAINDFNRLFQLPGQRLFSEAAFARSQVYLSRSDYANALKDLNVAIEHQPEFQPARSLRAQFHLLRGNTETGLQDVANLLKMEADDLPPVNQRGRNAIQGIALATKRFERGRFLRHLAQEGGVRQMVLAELAEQDLEHALGQGLNTVSVMRELAFTKRLLNQTKKALDIYDETVRSNPNDDQVRMERGWLLVQAFQNPVAAAVDFAAVLEIDPLNAEANSGAGFCAACQSDAVNARQYAMRALLQGGGDYLVLHNVACIHARLHRTTSNVEDAATALQVLRRAIVLWRQGGEKSPSALELILHEDEFQSISSRADFRKLFE